MDKKKIIVIILGIFVLVLLVIAGISISHSKKIKETPATGHFYGKPNNISDIKSIEIVYNNGKDYISISDDNQITYFTFDKEGKMIDQIVEEDTKDIIEYIYKNDIDYLKEYDHLQDEKWSLEVSGPGKSCTISKKTAQPKWFNTLLQKLNVDEYGYLSKGNKKEEQKETPATGHFYGKPNDVSEIRHIEIVYNDGKDYVGISSNNKISYYTFDENGKMKQKIIDKDTSSIIKYIFDNNLDYLKEYDHLDDEKWSLEVSGPGKSCTISKNDTQPEWFNTLLKKLNVDEYGYQSKK